MLGDSAKDTTQCSKPKNRMVWNGETLMLRFLGLENDVAALLINHAVSPIAAQTLNDLPPAQVPWQLHAQARISSRTRCSRMEEGSFFG